MKLNYKIHLSVSTFTQCLILTIVLVWYSLFIYSCANPVMPEGGPKDVTPPKYDSLSSAVPMERNYTKKPIRFKFNEWVVLDNVQNQLVVSPPLSYPPKVTLKGKTVEFQFNEKEVLQANTTYSIQFGNSIKDLTEGNIAENMRYVFSTGNEIDRAEVYGYAANAYTNEPLAEALVLLHSNFEDSSFVKQKPDYFGKTNKQGSFTISNVRPGKFRVFVLTDQNFNYRYDLETESIGFMDTLLTINKDQVHKTEIINVSRESQPAKVYAKKLNQPGIVSVYFTSNPVDVKYTVENKGQTYLVEREIDTLKVWYKQDSLIDWNIYFNNGSRIDTVKVKPLKMPEGKGKRKLNLSTGRILGITSITATDPFNLSFNNPLVRIDTSLIRLNIDSTNIMVKPEVTIDSHRPGKLSIRTKWQEGKSYALELLPGSLTDFFGNINDTIKMKIRIPSSKELGNISLHVTKLSENKQYILELYNATKKLVQSFKISGQTKWEKKLANLVPGAYEVVIIEDLNGNGIWDPANLKAKRQAEPVFRRKTDPLRANWELDLNFAL